uniref:Uncharacterized protein n=1 Tax=viral metagenome TaxID=1070528 RepID=A0A6M3XKF1_9ZZZZ
MMKEWVTSLLFLWRRQDFECITASRIISKVPGYLVYAHYSGGAQAGSKASIYNGESALEEKIVDLYAPTTGNDRFTPSFPFPFTKGLYAELDGSGTSLTVIFILKRE